MRLTVHEQTIIDAPVERVWRVLADPARRGEWNEKIVRVERVSSAAARVGDRYRVRYRLGRHERAMEAEVVACEAPRVLAVCERPTAGADPRCAVVLTWRVENAARGTRISQVVDITDAPMPWPVKLLMWVISRIGKPQGATVVETLGELVLTDP